MGFWLRFRIDDMHPTGISDRLFDRFRGFRGHGFAAAGLLLLLASPAEAAEPYRPHDPATVLLVRPTSATTALRQARDRAAATPLQKIAAAETAIRLGRSSGDVRYFGQAQALLSPWWRDPAPPPAVRLLRATLLQQRHRFTEALADLDALIAADPLSVQARLTRATVRLVRGDPLGARQDCAALITRAGFVAVATCLGAANAASGHAADALRILEEALQREPGTDAETLRWAETQAAGMAEQLGDAPRARQHYDRALALAQAAGETDVYLLGAIADFQLQRGEAAAVRASLAGLTAFDPLLLRLALAEHALAGQGDADAAAALAAHQAELAARFALAEARGDAAHTREMARMALLLDADASRALALAARNWSVQRETADAALLLAAAQAAGDPAAAQPVRDWLRTTGLQDVRLQALQP